MHKKVVIGLSGGVDSAVSALLLKQSGYDVIALFMKNWEEKDFEGNCTSDADFASAESVAQKLDIPLYTVNFTQEYYDLVFNDFLTDCKNGLTPNPDILCNRHIKFDFFYKKAKQLDADFLATGHYCQIQDNCLVKGKDPNKDQSYFLHAIDPSVLQNVLFPIGHLCKTEVRQIAKDHDLPNHERKDSTGICFIGKRNFKNFVSQYLGFKPGEIHSINGEVLGQHDGLAYLTLGQRKGLKIGGPGDAWFVVEKDLQNNICYVAQGHDHPKLYAQFLTATEPNWLTKPESFPLECTAKIRYRQEDVPCTIHQITPEEIYVHFHDAQRAITPGQYVVFYQKNICLGGAKIKSKSPILRITTV